MAQSVQDAPSIGRWSIADKLPSYASTHLQLGQLKQSGQSVLPKGTCHGEGSNSRPCVYRASFLTITPRFSSLSSLNNCTISVKGVKFLLAVLVHFDMLSFTTDSSILISYVLSHGPKQLQAFVHPDISLIFQSLLSIILVCVYLCPLTSNCSCF